MTKELIMKFNKYKYYVLIGSKVECWLGVCEKRKYINYFQYLYYKFNGYSARRELL